MPAFDNRPARPATRVVAGLLWAVAGGLGIGAQFGDVYRDQVGTGSVWIFGLWRQGTVSAGNESLDFAPYGVTALIATVLLLVATVLVFTIRGKWGVAIVGTFGSAMMFDEAVSYGISGLVDRGLGSVGPAWWLILGAGIVAVIGLVVALAERSAAWAAPLPGWPSPPPWPPHQAPHHGGPVQPGPPPPGPY